MSYTPTILPRYEVEEVPNAVVNQRVIKYVKQRDEDGKLIKDENGKVLQERVEEVVNVAEHQPVYDVYFPQGHHIRVVGEQSLKDMNLDGEAKLIDMNTGEEVPEGFTSLKSLVASKTKQKRRAR